MRGICQSGATGRLLLCSLALAAATPAAQGQRAPERQDGTGAPGRGAISGIVRKTNGERIPVGMVRLRDLAAGLATAASPLNASGEFQFNEVRPGPYIVEWVDDKRSQVAAVSAMFHVVAGSRAAIEIVLPGRWDTGALFWKSSTAVITAAVAGNVLGIAAMGRTASPER